MAMMRVPGHPRSARLLSFVAVQRASRHDESVLTTRLLWTDPRPVPRFNVQELVTHIVRDPGFYEPTEDDTCSVYWYFCQTHDRHYWHEACGQGPHLIALHCEEHGPENMWPQPLMLMFPEGFAPRLSTAQPAWIR